MSRFTESEIKEIMDFAHEVNGQAGFYNAPDSPVSTGLISINEHQLASGSTGSFSSFANGPIGVHAENATLDLEEAMYEKGYSADDYDALVEEISHYSSVDRSKISLPNDPSVSGILGTFAYGAKQIQLTKAAITAIQNGVPPSEVIDYARASAHSYANQPPECFTSGTPIKMWPGNVTTEPDSAGAFDEASMLSLSTERPIEDVSVGDIVVSYDSEGRLRPGCVTQLYRNRVRHVLDLFGLKVTPGHVTLCGDGKFEGEHVPILDILRSDGALVRADGSKVRAATGCDLRSEGDRMVVAIVGERQSSGQIKVIETGEIRAGTRVILESGQDVSVLELIEANGGVLNDDGYVQSLSDGPKLPFRWTFTPHLPRPEDYVLQRSAVTLSDIYDADEWEAVSPRMPAPCSKKTSEETTGHHKHLI